MARDIITALDVGTTAVQTIIAERGGEEGLRVLGVGISASAGVRRGMVVDTEEATRAIVASIREAERAAGVKVRSVWASVAGSHVSVASSRGVVAVSRADGEISPEDMKRAIAAAETFIPKNPNKEILHMIARDFRVDGEAGIKDPVGMHGVRLEADTMIIECSTGYLKNLIKSIEGAGVRVEDYIFGPFAAAEAVLTKRQKELGVLLLDIGGGTASFIMFEDGAPLHAGVLPVGGSHITNDVAIGFRTHVDTADRLKREYGTCLVSELPKKDVSVRFDDYIESTDEGEVREEIKEGSKKKITTVSAPSYSRRQLAEIIEARLQDLFELLQKELKRANRSALLPGGVVLVGGSSLLPGIVELTKREIRLPSELGVCSAGLHIADEKSFPMFATAYGVLLWAEKRTSGASAWDRKIPYFKGSSLIRWFKTFLP